MLPALRRALPVISVVLVAAAVYDGWLFYSRWQQSRDASHKAEQQEAENARRTLDAMGGGGLKILNFYATPANIRSGGSTRVCYGVMGAKTVRLEPPVEQLRPVPQHCFDVSPAKTTEYKLYAADEKGLSMTQALTVQVGASAASQ